MYRQLSVAAVIPAFNEERAILRAIDTVPGFVDHVVVVDDASLDATGQLASRRSVDVVRHRANRGVGAAIVTGYRRVLDCGIDVAAVMAGDGQMDPEDLPALLDPLADDAADYAKGNRFLHSDVWQVMPKSRIAGNVLLSLATKLTSGYRELFDSQCGYTAISRLALESVDLDRLFPRYGYPNDLLARLHAAGMRVVDVPVRPVYGAAWQSGIKLRTVVHPIPFVLARSWAIRVATESDASTRALPDRTSA
jgi:glycosyltransferase involved in cell wall biosynthesis